MLQQLHIPSGNIQLLAMQWLDNRTPNLPVVNDEVFVSADGTGTPRTDSLLSNAGFSSFEWQSLALEIPSVFGPDRVLPISCLKCHTF